MDFKGSTALITGASSGIGEVFARELAARGANVVLVARSEAKLTALAGELASKHSVTAEVMTADLGQPGAGRALAEQVAARGLTVDVLINNAGFGFLSPLVDADADMMSTMVALNVAALTDLTRAFLPGMVERDSGAIVNVASTAAFQPVPYMAVYGATKAYVLSFTEALWGETKGTGVRVTCLCPGATATAFFETAGEQAQVGKAMTPEAVVAAALRALHRGRPSVITGARNTMLAQTTRFAPRKMVANIAERTMRPKDGVQTGR